MAQARAKPLDLSHHFSKASGKRAPNVLKEYYKYLRHPEMTNLAGGLPFPKHFPFDTLELQTVHPGSLSGLAGRSPDPQAAGSLTPAVRIPRTSQTPSSIRKIDLDTTLQYAGAQGYPPLYAWLRRLATTVYHPNIPYEGGADIMIDGGSADGLAKVYELLFDHWDKESNDIRDRQGLLVEEFVYAPPIAQIRPRDVNIVSVKIDAEGMLAYGPGSLFDVLQTWSPERGRLPHVVYLIPTGQNPTSGVLSFQRRKEIYEVSSQFDLVIIEDDPYWNLYYPSTHSTTMEYRGSPASSNFPTEVAHNYCTQSLGGKSTGYQFLDELVPSFLSIDLDGRVIRLDSFSKTIAPGCRLGWITAQPSICEQIFRITDGTTQAPSHFVQAIVAQLLGDFDDSSDSKTKPTRNEETSTVWGLDGWVRWLEGLRSVSERRMTTMATILEENRFATVDAAQTEMFSFNWPMGGMFLWVRVNIFTHPLASSVDPRRLMLAFWIFCTEKPYQILTVPGGDLSANESIRDAHGYLHLRLCFAAVEEAVLEAKSLAFTDACRQFWTILEGKTIDTILKEEDTGKESNQPDREVVEDWSA